MASIYFIIVLHDINISKKDLEKIFTVTPVTITKTYKKIKQFGKIILNNTVCDILEQKINEYQNSFDYDLKFIKNCIRFGVKYDYSKLSINLQNSNDYLTLVDSEIHKIIQRTQNLYHKNELNHLIICNKCL